jgi:hypothetical protein
MESRKRRRIGQRRGKKSRFWARNEKREESEERGEEPGGETEESGEGTEGETEEEIEEERGDEGVEDVSVLLSVREPEENKDE